MAGVRAMAVMKSVGLHVAADGLALGNLSEPRNAGGSIVVVGDDPWIDSTQINNDSRFLSQHLNMPVLEPSTV
jgi:indolepyruvate ferredoxin oxidoreductase